VNTGTLQFISNVFFTRFFLQEKLSWRVVIATFLIVVGVIITVSFSNHSSEVYTIQDLLQLYDQDYLFFLQVIGLVLLIQLLIYIIYTQRERSKYPLPLSMIIRPITFSSFAATIGSQSVLQSKCIAEVIRSSSSGDIQSSEWFIGVIVTVFITGIIIWLVCLNEGR
jgi:drug/metabolite transporter (DMT)-like permease